MLGTFINNIGIKGTVVGKIKKTVVILPRFCGIERGISSNSTYATELPVIWGSYLPEILGDPTALVVN